MPKMLTNFQQALYHLLTTLPAGKVTSYGALARKLGRGSARSVGQALRRNPRAPLVPCHRVLRRDGSLGGYLGQTGAASPELRRKIELLAAEGVEFGMDGRLLEPERLVDDW